MRVGVNLAGIGQLVIPAERLNILTDEYDNRILEYAIAGTAAAIVTGDNAMLMLKRYRHIRIISLSEFLKWARACGHRHKTQGESGHL